MAFDYRSEYQRYRHYYTNLSRFYQKPVAKVSIFVVISFMTVSFFSLFAIKPTLVTISELVREIEDKKIVNQQMDGKLNDLARAQSEYLAIQNDLPIIFTALPEDPAVAKLILTLELAAVRQQVTWVNLQVEPVELWGGKTKREEQVVKFSGTVGGSFENLKSFLAAMDKLDRVTVVKESSFSVGTPFLKKSGVEITVGVEGEAHFIV